MQPLTASESTCIGKLFEVELTRLVPKEHRLVVLSQSLNWRVFEEKFEPLYPAGGRPTGMTIRALVGLLILKQMHNVSDDVACRRLSEIPSWQLFCGYRYHQKKISIVGTTLGRFRQRIGAEGFEAIFAETVRLGQRNGLVSKRDLERIHVDTTVQEKNIAYPHDGKHLYRVLNRILKSLKKKGLKPKQSYRFVGKKHLVQSLRYRRARQSRRANREQRKLATCVRRLANDAQRRMKRAGYGDDKEFCKLICMAHHLIEQSRGSLTGREKIYSIHEPDVECISKGKVHKKYEYGVKVSFGIVDRTNFIIGCQVHPNAPHDSETLRTTLEHIHQMTGHKAQGACGVDLGYRGHGIPRNELFVVHPRLRKLPKRLKRLRRRRSKIESVVSFVKRRCRMGRNYLKGKVGDLMNAYAAAAAYNIRLFLRHATAT